MKILGAYVSLRLPAVLILVVVAAVLAIFEYPSVLGRWEDESTFRMMPGSGPPLSFALYLRGDVGGSGRYALVNLGYYSAEWLGWSLRAFRLPVLVAGFGSVLFFAVIATRSFGFWPGVIGGLTLALNPMFLLFWHQLIVVMLTMLLLLLVIERYQQVERCDQTRWSFWWSVMTLAFAFALLLLHYAVGRVYGAAVIGFWTATVCWHAGQAWRSKRPIAWRTLVAPPVCGLLVAGFLVLLEPGNVQHLAAPHQIFFPPIGEYARSGGDLAVVFENLPIMLTMIVPPLNLAPNRFGDYPTDLMVDHRYYLVPTVTLPLVLLGLGLLIARARASANARLTLMLLAITVIGPLFSSQVGQYLSIASYRTFYAVIPLTLCMAAGIGWLLEYCHPVVRGATAGALILLLVYQGVSVTMEMARHHQFVADLVQRWRPELGAGIFEGAAQRRTTQDDEYLLNGTYRHYIDGGVVSSLATAQKIASAVQALGASDDVVIVRLDGPIPAGEALGGPALVFYLRDLGVPAAVFDARTERIRGAGWQSPRYVLAFGERAARSARDRLRAAGKSATIRTVRLADREPPLGARQSRRAG